MVHRQRFTKGLHVTGQIRLQVLHGQVPDVAELVELLHEELKVLGICRLAERQVQCVQLFVLHQDVLDNFALQLGDIDASDLEHAESAPLVEH